MKIASLKECKEFISTLEKWHYDEWSYLHDVDSVERRISEFENELGSDEIPQTFVAVEGHFCLVEQGMPFSELPDKYQDL